MRKKVKQYFDKCVEHILKNTAWSFIKYIFTIFVLNIPQIIKFENDNISFWQSLADVLSAISIILIIFAVILLVKLKTEDSKSSPSNYNSMAQANSEEQDRKTETESPEGQIDSNKKKEGNVAGNSQEQNNSSKKEEGQNKMLDCFHFKRTTISMNINAYNDIIYTMEYDGIATKQNVECFNQFLSWTGNSYISSELISHNVDAHLEDNIEKRTVPPYPLRVVFDEDISENERVKFSIKTLVSDDTKTMIPVSSFYVKYPTDEIILKVSAPNGLIHTVRKKCYQDANREIQIFSSKSVGQEALGGHRCYTYRILKPTPLLYYTLEWRFSEKY